MSSTSNRRKAHRQRKCKGGVLADGTGRYEWCRQQSEKIQSMIEEFRKLRLENQIRTLPVDSPRKTVQISILAEEKSYER